MINLVDALVSLRPGAIWVVRGEEIEWLDETQTQPTETEIQTERTRLQAEYEATQYQRNRQPEYPSLATLADALYWSNQGDNTKLDEYYAACAAVKAKYPKPEVN
jgi:hypothetical protein